MMVNRKVPIVRHPLDQPTISSSGKFNVHSLYGSLSRPPTSSRSSSSGVEEPEQVWKMDERWRCDTDAGVPIGNTGLGELLDLEDTRLIVDDFDISGSTAFSHG